MASQDDTMRGDSLREHRAAAPPCLVVVMGVSGCGKSTLSAALSERLGLGLMEADDFHSPKAVSRMRSGEPLTDAWREPWVAAMCEHLRLSRDTTPRRVLAWSALKRAHRLRLRELGEPTLFLHLRGDRELVAERMRQRDHFMPQSLLDSQYAAMEPPRNEPDILELDLAASLEALCETALGLIDSWVHSG